MKDERPKAIIDVIDPPKLAPGYTMTVRFVDGSERSFTAPVRAFDNSQAGILKIEQPRSMVTTIHLAHVMVLDVQDVQVKVKESK